MPLRIGSGSSTDIDAARAAAEAATDATADFDGEEPNLVIAFISDDHRDAAEDIAAFLGERFPAAATIGSTVEGVVAGARELEGGPAVSIWAAFLPDTHVVPFGLRFEDRVDGEHAYSGWPDVLLPDAGLIMFCDRFSFPAAHFAREMNETRPGTVVVGGVSGAGRVAGDSRLFYGGKVFTEGAVMVAVSGRVRLQGLVSPGCRPIGRAATITRADRQMIFEIAGERPVDLIGSMFSSVDPEVRLLMQDGLQLGVIVDEYKTEYDTGDFITRPVMGSDPVTGSIAVGDVVEVGQTVQFHVRDPKTADEALRARIDTLPVQPAGALLFTCNGRGQNMFHAPDHDASLISKRLGVPLAGAFVAGELGPVGSTNALHGFSASVALFVDSAA